MYTVSVVSVYTATTAILMCVPLYLMCFSVYFTTAPVTAAPVTAKPTAKPTAVATAKPTGAVVVPIIIPPILVQPALPYTTTVIMSDYDYTFNVSSQSSIRMLSALHLLSRLLCL
jgi:hypothetical protein